MSFTWQSRHGELTTILQEWSGANPHQQSQDSSVSKTSQGLLVEAIQSLRLGEENGKSVRRNLEEGLELGRLVDLLRGAGNGSEKDAIHSLTLNPSKDLIHLTSLGSGQFSSINAITFSDSLFTTMFTSGLSRTRPLSPNNNNSNSNSNSNSNTRSTSGTGGIQNGKVYALKRIKKSIMKDRKYKPYINLSLEISILSVTSILSSSSSSTTSTSTSTTSSSSNPNQESSSTNLPQPQPQPQPQLLPFPQFIASVQSEEELFLVMEYATCGSLWDILCSSTTTTTSTSTTTTTPNSKPEPPGLPERDLLFYIPQLILALQFLHNHLKIVHRDIKPQNILITEGGRVLITDFGSCGRLLPFGRGGGSKVGTGNGLVRRISYGECGTLHGTVDYIAPEILSCLESVLQGKDTSTSNSTQEYGYSSLVDYWSLGVMIYELKFGKPPFWSETVEETFGLIQEVGGLGNGNGWELKFPRGVVVSFEFKGLCRRLITREDQRIGYNDPNEIKKLAFFHKTNWSDVIAPPKGFTPPLPLSLENSSSNEHGPSSSSLGMSGVGTGLGESAFRGRAVGTPSFLAGAGVKGADGIGWQTANCESDSSGMDTTSETIKTHNDGKGNGVGNGFGSKEKEDWIGWTFLPSADEFIHYSSSPNGQPASLPNSRSNGNGLYPENSFSTPAKPLGYQNGQPPQTIQRSSRKSRPESDINALQTLERLVKSSAQKKDDSQLKKRSSSNQNGNHLGNGNGNGKSNSNGYNDNPQQDHNRSISELSFGGGGGYPGSNQNHHQATPTPAANSFGRTGSSRPSSSSLNSNGASRSVSASASISTGSGMLPPPSQTAPGPTKDDQKSSSTQSFTLLEKANAHMDATVAVAAELKRLTVNAAESREVGESVAPIVDRLLREYDEARRLKEEKDARREEAENAARRKEAEEKAEATKRKEEEGTRACDHEQRSGSTYESTRLRRQPSITFDEFKARFDDD